MDSIFEAMEAGTLDTPRGPVAYWVQRAPSPLTLVFLHGLFCDHRIFENQAAAFSGRYNLLFWDSPAHRLSRPCTVHTYTYDALALREILNREKLPGPVLIGHGLGGAVAQVYLRHQSAAGFVGICSPSFGEDSYRGWELWMLWQCQWVCVCFSRAHLTRKLGDRASQIPAIRQTFLAMLSQYSRKELCRLLTLGTSGFLKENRAQPLPCPACLILGGEERLTGLQLHSRQFAQDHGLVPEEIPSAGHLVPLEASAELNRLIEAFLKTLSHA